METMPEPQRQSLLKKWHQQKNEIALVCTCNPPHKISMTVAYYEEFDKFSLRTYPSQKHLHSKWCFFYGGTYNKKNNHESSWKEMDNGNISVKLFEKDFKNQKHQKNEDVQKTKIHQNLSSSLHDSGTSKGKLTLYEFSRRLLIKSWDDFIFFKGRNHYPTLVDVYDQLVRYTIKKVMINRVVSLDQLMYFKGKVGKIYIIEKQHNFKFFPYFLLKYVKHENKDKNVAQLFLQNPLTSEEVVFDVDRILIEECFKKTIVKDGPYMIGGFVRSGGYEKNPIVHQIAVIPINEHGVVVESSYERRFYDKVCEEKRLVQRIYDTKYHPKWNGIKPDGLFIDTSPHTVVEIFGISESMEYYHEARKLKIEHFSRLQPHYAFWYWDAYKRNDIPAFPLSKK
jgi:hypothetical protein